MIPYASATGIAVATAAAISLGSSCKSESRHGAPVFSPIETGVIATTIKLDYSLEKGWRAEIAADPKLLDEGCDGWVKLWAGDYAAADEAFRSSCRSPDEAAAGGARASLALASLLSAAASLHNSLQAEIASYRIRERERIEPGRFTPLVGGIALLRLGRLEESRRMLSLFAATGDAEAVTLAAAIRGDRPEATEPAPPEPSDRLGVTPLASLVAPREPRFVEQVREGENQAALRHFDPDLFSSASIDACQGALDATLNRGPAFDPLSCEAAACSSDGARAEEVCRTAAGSEGSLPWYVLRYGSAETADDLRALAAARGDHVASVLGDRAAGDRLEANIREAGATTVAVVSVAPDALERGEALALLRRHLAELRSHVSEVKAAWGGPGAEALAGMAAAERHGEAVAAAAARALVALEEPLAESLPLFEWLYSQDRSPDPEYLVMLARAYIDANRFADALRILRSMEERFPIMGALREEAEIVSIQRTLDTRGAARRE